MKALVTGGGGFLGSAIVRQLLDRGDTVRSFSRGAYPELAELGVECLQGDIADAAALAAAVAGCDVVFHVAAKAGMWGAYEGYYEANVTGTRNVIEACRAHGITRLVNTSSPSVVSGGNALLDVDESAAYPENYLTHYPRTKAEAERLVRAANSPELATVSLRPPLIWGPGDNHIIPRLIVRARAGKLKRVGSGKNLLDIIYIDNAARAHLQAADALAPGSSLAGQVYFISQGEPVLIWDFIDRVLVMAGLKPIESSVPATVAFGVGWLAEVVYGLLGKEEEPMMTRFVARQLSNQRTFDISAARRDFGFDPTVSTEEGLERLRDWMASSPLEHP